MFYIQSLIDNIDFCLTKYTFFMVSYPIVKIVIKIDTYLQGYILYDSENSCLQETWIEL